MRKLICIVVVGAVVSTIGMAVPAVGADGVRYVDLLFDGVDVTTDVVYGEATNSRGETEELKLDIYEGTGDDATGRGLYIWAHGGNFRVGDKSSNGAVVDYARRGWVTMSINYRVRPELVGNAAIGILTNPDQITVAQAAAKDAQHDMQAAVRWARANAASLGIDPARIAVGGGSAGAIMALMTAFNPGDAGNSGTPGVSSAVAAAVSHAGAYVPGLQGAAPARGAPPVAMYHGTNDEQVPYPTAPPACVLTIAMANTCELVTFVAEDHEYLGFDIARDFLYRHVILGRVETRTPLVTDVEGDPLTVLGGAEPAGVGIGATAGVVSSKDPQTLADGFVLLLRYVTDSLGIPLPI